MDFLIAGIIIATIAWFALRPRFGISQGAYRSKAKRSLAELGMDARQLPAELKPLFEHELETLWEEKGRQANPHEMACAFYLKAIKQHPEATKKAAQSDRPLIHAMVKVASWRGEELGSKYADLIALELKLRLNDGQILPNEVSEQA